MKHIFRYLFALIFLTGISSMSISAKKVALRLNLKKGDRFEYVISSNNKMDQKVSGRPVLMEQNLALTVNQLVVDHLDNGNYLFEADYKRFRLKVSMNGEGLEFDSDTVDMGNTLYQPLKGISKIHLSYEVSPSGIVTNLKGLDELKSQLAKSIQLTNLLREFGTDKYITKMFNYIPKEKVGIGDKWIVAEIMPEIMDMKYDINYTMEEASSENIKLKIRSDFTYTTDQPIIRDGKNVKIKEDGVQNGKVMLDAKNGMPVSSVLEQKIDLVSTSTDTKTKAEVVTQIKLYSETSLILVK